MSEKPSGRDWLIFGMGAVIFVVFFLFSGEFKQRIVSEGQLTSCIRALNEAHGGR